MRPFWVLATATVAIWLLVALGTSTATPGPTTRPAPASYVHKPVKTIDSEPVSLTAPVESGIQSAVAQAQGVAYLAAIRQAQLDQAAASAASSLLAASQSARTTSNAQSASAGGWSAVATCEEGGRNDPTFGYYGILPSSWNGYDGVSTAGQASQQQQLDWEAANVGSPPDESGGCHGY